MLRVKTKAVVLWLVLTSAFQQGLTQTHIRGRVTDVKGKPLMYANILLKNSYDGAIADSLGQFLIPLKELKDSLTLEARMMGYAPAQQKIGKAQFNKPMLFALRQELSVLEEALVTAGSFEASDKKRASAVLNTLDVLTTAGSNADIMAAIRTLPGAQKVGNQTGLFVRGGAGNETKQFIDGTLVSNPFYPSAPDLAQRARFSPYLFKGIIFNTGGYSALYGQALSSAVILETIDLPEKSEKKFSFSTAFIEAGMQHLTHNKKASYGFNYNHTNLAPYFSVVPQRFDYHKTPRIHDAEGNARIKTKNGIVKFYSLYSDFEGGFRRATIDSAALKSEFSNQNKNWYNNLSWKENWGNGWKTNVGTGFSISDNRNRQLLLNSTNEHITTGVSYLDAISFPVVNSIQQLMQTKVVLEKNFAKSALRFGGEWQRQKETLKGAYAANLNDNLSATFAETDVNLTQAVAVKAGVRFEYSSLLKQAVVMPRLAMACKTGKNSQVSLAYGTFFQKPENEYLFRSARLQFAKADHFIVNFQKMTPLQTLRAEAFYKTYQHLVKTAPACASDGNGYAKGIELFWRDKKTLKHIDYWVSYSLLDSKREDLNFPRQLQPTYAAKHTAHLVEKFFIPHIKTGFSITNSFTYGFPYYFLRRPNNSSEWQVSEEGTLPYNYSTDISLYHLPFFAKKTKRALSVVVFASVSNVFNRNLTYGYNFTHDGSHKEPVLPTANQFYFLGLFINLGEDRSGEAIDGQLNR